jgi:multidrug resistance protein
VRQDTAAVIAPQFSTSHREHIPYILVINSSSVDISKQGIEKIGILKLSSCKRSRDSEPKAKMAPPRDDERQPLLQDERDHRQRDEQSIHRPDHLEQPSDGDGDDEDPKELSFTDDDPENPRAWSYRTKMTNVFLIASMAILAPLASSMFAPGIDEIAQGLHTSIESVIACTTAHVVCQGIGPLILAPLCETFGRRPLYLICFGIFALLQIPSALAPNIATLIAMRTLSGLFGSVGVANGGGSLSDMFVPSQRAGVYGWYLLGPLLGPCIGPLLGGVIVQHLGWRWIFWVLTFITAAVTLAAYFFLHESYAPVLLYRRKRTLEEQSSDFNISYSIKGHDTRPLKAKLLHSLSRPFRILFTPIVLMMSTYQAVCFATAYSIFTNLQRIYGGEYGFNNEQVGLTSLGPGLGFLTAVWFIVPRIDTVYNRLTAKNDGVGKPEYRLPLANIGGVLLPVGLFWFAWTVETHRHWFVTLAATYFFGVGQVSILNCTTNYYIDCELALLFSRALLDALFEIEETDFADAGDFWQVSRNMLLLLLRLAQ